MIDDVGGPSSWIGESGGPPGLPDTAEAIVSEATHDWDDEGWRDHAACRSTQADLFFPVGQTRAAIEQIQAAKSVCQACVVRETCLSYALETNQEAGIWGGTSEDERRKMRRSWATRRRRLRPVIV